MNNNYILARWRDASTDPPAAGWIGLNTMANGSRYYGACGYMPGDQWLDITAIPGVPREAVQAAVDDIEETVRMFVGHAEADWRGCISDGLSDAIKAITHHTGVKPTEVL